MSTGCLGSVVPYQAIILEGLAGPQAVVVWGVGGHGGHNAGPLLQGDGHHGQRIDRWEWAGQGALQYWLAPVNQRHVADWMKGVSWNNVSSAKGVNINGMGMC